MEKPRLLTRFLTFVRMFRFRFPSSAITIEASMLSLVDVCCLNVFCFRFDETVPTAAKYSRYMLDTVGSNFARAVTMYLGT